MIRPGWLPDDEDLRRLGVYALVAICVGLLGWVVSAQFDPLDVPLDVPGSSTVTSSSTTAPGPGTSTTVAPGSTTTNPAAGSSASFEVSTAQVDFGDAGTSVELSISNVGDGPGQWSIESGSEAVAVSPASGELATGASETVVVTLDRGLVAEGDLTGTITLSWAEGEVVVTIVGSHEDNPIIHNPRVSPAEVNVAGGSGCSPTQATVSARIRDTSAIESVVVRWSKDGTASTETTMIAVGNDIFEGVVGPFSAAQSAQIRIVAFDVHGNAGGANTVLSVVACP